MRARLAAGRISPDGIRTLRELTRQMEVPGLPRLDDNTINDRFHDLIAQAAENTLMLQFHRRTMLIATHDLGLVRDIAGRTVFMVDGEVLEEGPTAQVLDAPRQTRTRHFLATVAGA